MRIVADEGIERPIVVRLRAEGHHVTPQSAPPQEERDKASH